MKMRGKSKRPNRSLIHKRGRKIKGKFDYEEAYPKGNGWICAVGRVGEPRHVLGPYTTREEAQAEAETWRLARLAAAASAKNEITTRQLPQMNTTAFPAEANGDSRLF